MKYIIEIKSEYEDSFKGLMILGAKDSNLFVDTVDVANLEVLNSDYINEHFGDLQDTAYKKGFEDGKAVNDKDCEGCEHEGKNKMTNPCILCCNSYKNRWEAKSDKIVVGDEVEWTGDKYIVTYINYNIDTSEITDYDLLGEDGSVADHVKKCAFVKTGRHFDIASILEDMRND